MDSEKVEIELTHLYEYVEYTTGDKQLAIKLAIKLIENEYVHDNYNIVYDELLTDLLEESRLHQKTMKAIENQSFFKKFIDSSITDEKSKKVPIETIETTKHTKSFKLSKHSKLSVIDYFAVDDSDDSDDHVVTKEIKKDIITIDVESMPKESTAKAEKDAKSDLITHTGGSYKSSEGEFSIFCDGACKNNGKKNAKAGYGLSVQHNYKEIYIVSKPLEDSEPQTNQRAELHALSDALDIAYKKINYLAMKMDIPVKKVHIYSDSEYSINCLTKWAPSWSRKGWRKADGKEVLHDDIIKPMFEDWTNWNKHTNGILYDIQIHHVRSHTGRTDPISLGNERADELAVLSIS